MSDLLRLLEDALDGLVSDARAAIREIEEADVGPAWERRPGSETEAAARSTTSRAPSVEARTGTPARHSPDTPFYTCEGGAR